MILLILIPFDKELIIEYPETVEMTASGQTGGEDRMEFSNALLRILPLSYCAVFSKQLIAITIPNTEIFIIELLVEVMYSEGIPIRISVNMHCVSCVILHNIRD